MTALIFLVARQVGRWMRNIKGRVWEEYKGRVNSG